MSITTILVPRPIEKLAYYVMWEYEVRVDGILQGRTHVVLNENEIPAKSIKVEKVGEEWVGTSEIFEALECRPRPWY